MSGAPLRILSLASLYPSAAAPNLGRFVEASLDAAEATGTADVTRIAPRGLPPAPLDRLGRYAALRRLPATDCFRDATVHRPVYRVTPGLWHGRHPAAIARAVLPLAREWHRQAPLDLVDAQFFWPDAPAAMLVARALGLPFSAKARGADIHYWGRQRGSANRIRQAGRAAAGLLAVSETMKRDMTALGMPAERITVHLTGLDRAIFHPPPPGSARRDGPPRIACVGALVPRKRQALAIRAVALLREAELLLVGDGPDRARLEALATELGVRARVRFAGAMPLDAIGEVLRDADAAILPSVSEGLANAWVEALACGTPLVVTDAGGAREVVTGPHLGRIADPEPPALAAALGALLAAPPGRAMVAAGADRFDWQVHGQALVRHWRAIAAGGQT